MNPDFKIPKLMAHLPVDGRGYPIPYFVPFVNGKPDFRYQDPKKRSACLLYKKCAICGNRLFAADFWFICGPQGLKNEVHSDAPMHEACAEFSINVCPHLLFHKAERRSVDLDNNPALVRDKPENIFLVKADKVWTINVAGHTYIKFRTVRYVKFTYENNKLVLA